MLSSSVFWKVLTISWVVTPVGMIAVGWFFERRLIPLWRYQSRAFMPGDLALGVVMAVGWYLYPQIPLGNFWCSATMPAIALFMAAGTCFIMRVYVDGECHYSPAQLRSPTKRYHDYVLYIGFLWALITFAVPGIFVTSWSGPNLEVKVMAIAAFTVWLGGMAQDALNPRMPYPEMHIDDWRRHR